MTELARDLKDIVAAHDGDMRHEHDRFLASQAERKQQREMRGDSRIGGKRHYRDLGIRAFEARLR